MVCPINVFRVVVDGYSVKGKLQFAGRLRGTSDRSEWYGVKFDSAVGDCDGSRAGIAYFTCDYNCGILVSVKSNVVFMARRSKPVSRGTTNVVWCG